MIAAGLLFFVTGVYGVTRQLSTLTSGLGIVLAIGGISLLLWVSRPWRLTSPNLYVIGITIGTFALHSYEHFLKSEGDPSLGYLIWAMIPYAFSLLLSSFSSLGSYVISGAVIAFGFDIWGHYTVFINPQSSTAALALLFIPLWSTIIMVPLATFFGYSIGKKRLSRRATP
jgi:hypothetical protein